MANRAARLNNPYEVIHRKGVNAGTVARAACGDCGTIKEKTLTKHMPPDQVIKKFRQDGWESYGHDKPTFMCPDCQNKKPEDAGKVADVEQQQPEPARDPDTGERPQKVGIYIKATLQPSKGMTVRLPYEVWTAIGSPERIAASVADNGCLALQGTNSVGIKLQQQGQGQAWAVLSPKRLPDNSSPNSATKPIHIDADLYRSQNALVLPVEADKVFKTISELGQPMDHANKVVKLREDEQPLPPQPEPQQPQQQPKSEGQPQDLAQEGRDLFDSLNDWVARMLEDNKEVIVTQDKDGYVNARVRYVTEFDL